MNGAPTRHPGEGASVPAPGPAVGTDEELVDRRAVGLVYLGHGVLERELASPDGYDLGFCHAARGRSGAGFGGRGSFRA